MSTDEEKAEAIIAEAKISWVNIMAQFTELPREMFDSAFDLVVNLGAQKGRIQGAVEAFDRMQAWCDAYETQGAHGDHT